MTTSTNQMTLSELEKATQESTLTRWMYVLRRWPLIPFFILGVLVLCAIFSPLIAPYEPEKDQLRAVLAMPFWSEPCEEGQISNKFQPCNTNGIGLGKDERVYHFVLGADQLGRDLLSRIIYGARLSLSLAAVAIIIGTVFGTTVGLVAGYYGGIIDEVIMRVVDVFNAIPYLLLAIALVFVLGQSFAVVAFVLALGAWAGIARLVRGQTLQVRHFDYIALARVAGASTPRIMVKHLLPAVGNTVIVATTLQVG
ncbi:MAG: ABC transporter permease, partial [Chloroflexota bacterium]|nr:ABC transporter permease [Chloroflexota bacterium]